MTLHGVAGDCQVTHGGITNYECVTSEGTVVLIHTFSYHNPDQSVRLFSPHAYFHMRPYHSGAVKNALPRAAPLNVARLARRNVRQQLPILVRQ